MYIGGMKVDNGVLDAHTNVYIYLTIRYWGTFWGDKSGLVFIADKTAFKGDWLVLHRLTICCWASQTNRSNEKQPQMPYIGSINTDLANEQPNVEFFHCQNLLNT